MRKTVLIWSRSVNMFSSCPEQPPSPPPSLNLTHKLTQFPHSFSLCITTFLQNSYNSSDQIKAHPFHSVLIYSFFIDWLVSTVFPLRRGLKDFLGKKSEKYSPGRPNNWPDFERQPSGLSAKKVILFIDKIYCLSAKRIFYL